MKIAFHMILYGFLKLNKDNLLEKEKNKHFEMNLNGVALILSLFKLKMTI
jgi:hypothetical protein